VLCSPLKLFARARCTVVSLSEDEHGTQLQRVWCDCQAQRSRVAQQRVARGVARRHRRKDACVPPGEDAAAVAAQKQARAVCQQQLRRLTHARPAERAARGAQGAISGQRARAGEPWGAYRARRRLVMVLPCEMSADRSAREGAGSKKKNGHR
jgi:hypothetical protein